MYLPSGVATEIAQKTEVILLSLSLSTLIKVSTYQRYMKKTYN